MYTLKFFDRKLFLAIAASLTLCSGLAKADNETGPNQLTQQAVAKYKDGKLSEAVDIEDQAIKQQPKEWLPHSVMSFFYWQQGNVIDAVAEGLKAIRYAPQNSVAVLNMAHIYQSMQNYQDAISLYDQARKLTPESWDPHIGLAQCYFANNQSANGLEVLQDMSARTSSDYGWWYRLGDIYLSVDKPDLAVAPLTKAASLASTSEQKSQSGIALFIALLRDNQFEKASSMMNVVLQKYQPDFSEVYVRAAADLLPAAQPSSAKELLNVATAKLDHIRDSDAFFRLGEVFEDKADHAGDDKSTANGWLDNAEYAFKQAIDLNPGVGAYHLALAAVLERKGATGEAAKEADQALSFDNSDLLAAYLKSHLQSSPAGDNSQKKGGSQEKPLPVSLTAVRFTVEGLTCNCQSAKIESALLQKGVVYSHVSRLKPYEGIMLLDQTVAAAEKVFSECPDKAFGSSAILEKPITFPIVSQQPISSLEAAVRLSQNSTYGDVQIFPRQFEITGPQVPAVVAGRDGSSS